MPRDTLAARILHPSVTDVIQLPGVPPTLCGASDFGKGFDGTRRRGKQVSELIEMESEY